MMENLIPIETSKVVIEVVRRETVKPLTPTPDHLKKFGMTVHDQIATTKYMPIVFFYSAGREMCAADRTRRLKESLSETLVRFYPVVGRVDMEGVYVDCNDAGVDFVGTKVNGCSLADIPRCPDNEVMSKLFPRDITTSGPGHLIGLQSNLFECGGMAVGTCFSHLIMDACGRSAFLKEWTAAVRGAARRSPPPDLDAIASRFPAVPPSIISRFKKEMRDLTRGYATQLTDSAKILEAARELVKLWRDDMDLYFFSSLCGFELYESDFGWGKPVWISIPILRTKNRVIMIDAREIGAIEAWIRLREEHMAFFKTDTDLLKFASLNLSIRHS